MAKKLIGELELNRIYQRDCIEGMRMLPDKSIDMILCDLPYGTTRNKWDTIIPFDELWAQYERIIKDNGAIVLTAAQPFTSALISSNFKRFRYCLVWEKERPTDFLNAKVKPLNQHEDIAIFYKRKPTYNPQFIEGKPYKTKNRMSCTSNYGEFKEVEEINTGFRYPISIISIARDKEKLHPTQKPVALFEYLLKTYTNEGDTVLDNCIGSGTTAVAAVRNNRNFIGFELESKYIEIANKRLDNETEANG